MRILLDTSILLWAVTGDKRLDRYKNELMTRDNQVYFSSASIWEISIKHSKGLLGIPPEEVYKSALDQGYEELVITGEHTISVSTLNKPEDLDHKDPFDRMLLAQAKYDHMTLFTSDKKIAIYDEPCVKLIAF